MYRDKNKRIMKFSGHEVAIVKKLYSMLQMLSCKISMAFMVLFPSTTCMRVILQYIVLYLKYIGIYCNIICIVIQYCKLHTPKRSLYDFTFHPFTSCIFKPVLIICEIISE